MVCTSITKLTIFLHVAGGEYRITLFVCDDGLADGSIELTDSRAKTRLPVHLGQRHGRSYIDGCRGGKGCDIRLLIQRVVSCDGVEDDVVLFARYSAFRSPKFF